MKFLQLIRGLPGSGKSTLAQDYVNLGYMHVEADMYFVQPNGQYLFEGPKVPQAHKWCQNRTRYYLSTGRNVVVSNTFVRLWEMWPYDIIALEFGATLKVREATGNYPNVHGVPEQAIEIMRKNWEQLPRVAK